MHVNKLKMYEKQIFTPPRRPVSHKPFPRPPASTCAFNTTSATPVFFAKQKVEMKNGKIKL